MADDSQNRRTREGAPGERHGSRLSVRKTPAVPAPQRRMDLRDAGLGAPSSREVTDSVTAPWRRVAKQTLADAGRRTADAHHRAHFDGQSFAGAARRALRRARAQNRRADDRGDRRHEARGPAGERAEPPFRPPRRRGWKAPAASRRPSSGRHPAPTFSRERERTNASHSPWEGGSQRRSRTNASHSPWDEGGCPGHGPNRPS